MTAMVVDRETTWWVSGPEQHSRPTPAGALSNVAWMLAYATTPGTSLVIPADPLGLGRAALVAHVNECPSWDAQPMLEPSDTGPGSAWLTARHRQGPRIAIGIREWMDDPYLPEELDSLDLVHRLADWEDAMGHRYQHTPGASALMALRARGITGGVRWRLQNPASAEWWQPPANIPEWRWTAPRRGHSGRTVHRWDMRRAYLAAASAAELPRLRLKPTGAGAPLDTPGYVRARLTVSDAAPTTGLLLTLVSHWAGTWDRQRTVWLTTPVARELAAQGVNVEVIDSFTADDQKDRPGRLLRPWADGIRAAINGGSVPDYQEDWNPGLRPALKAGYSQAIGLMAVPRGSVYRPDWRHLIIGTQQASMLRRIGSVARLCGLWPVKVDVDCLWYATDNPTQVGEALGATADLTGRFRYEGEHTP